MVDELNRSTDELMMVDKNEDIMIDTLSRSTGE